MVLPRIITALVGAPLILFAIWCGSLPWLVLTLAIVFLSLWEFYSLCELGGYPAQVWPGILFGLLLAFSFYIGGFPRVVARSPGVPFLITVVMLCSFLIEFARPDKGLSLLRICTTLLGFMLIAWPMSHLLLLRDLRMEVTGRFDAGRDLTYLAIFVLWVQDIFAWLIGRAIGKRRLAPAISPRKTWEGAIGGGIACVVIGLLWRELFLQDVLGRTETIFVCIALSVLAQISDLTASFLKRALGTKDFSELLPGHGGVLDRFDALLFTIPLFYYYLIGTGRFQ